MRSVLLAVGAVYFLLVANFYNESHGFTEFYNAMYAVWKVVPIVFLTIFAALDGGGLPTTERTLCALGLFFGGVGDVLIGLSHEGIVTGAIAFGIGHFFYMVCYCGGHFFSRPTTWCWPLLVITFLWGIVIGEFCVFPMFDEHPFAVTVMVLYSLILSSCLVLTGSQYYNRQKVDDKEGLLLRYIGFLMFYISDSVLIMNHTGHKIPFPQLIILGTYYTAQYLILCGNIHTALHVKVIRN
ncbi:unnamed protein product [Angiostrongylus costaricensis]|uniref:lysoplasmalogenase n=1 Tax=Angiostrongylus costaricensis TaxID=334426 RepID=A0A0R3PWZ0_ANGCS|nr:unnamed protein product [Angiostrongylus costaricensis]